MPIAMPILMSFGLVSVAPLVCLLDFGRAVVFWLAAGLSSGLCSGLSSVLSSGFHLVRRPDSHLYTGMRYPPKSYL